jgi:hypothetical protein
MTILVFISFAIFQATTETYKLRDSLSREGNFYNEIRLSMSIVSRDIALIYSPTILVPPKKKDPTAPAGARELEVIMSDDLGRAYTFWGVAQDESGLRPSRFIGTDTKMTFVSASHVRIYKDSPESEFAKVTYEVKRDTKNAETNPDTMVLIKTETPNAFASDDIKDTMSKSYELLHGIKKFQFTYYLRDGNTWKTSKSWDSDKEETKNIFPDIIEISLEVKGDKNLGFEGKFKFRPEIPLDGLEPSS